MHHCNDEVDVPAREFSLSHTVTQSRCSEGLLEKFDGLSFDFKSPKVRDSQIRTTGLAIRSFVNEIGL